MPAGVPGGGDRGDGMLTLYIDSQAYEVAEGTPPPTVLEAARAAGVFIPALCDPFPVCAERRPPGRAAWCAW